MKATFFHDTLFKNYRGTYYADTDLSYSFLSTYLKYFDKLTVVAREEKTDKIDTKKFGVANGVGVGFDCTRSIGIKTYFSGYLRKKVRKNVKDADFIIIRLPSIMGIIAASECRRQKKPYLIEVVANAFYAHWYHGNKFFKVLSFPIEFLVKRSIRKAPYVLYVSKYLKRAYKTNGKTMVVSDVRINNIKESYIKKRLKNIDNYDNKTKYNIGLIGSMDVIYKGHREAIKALGIVRRSGIDADMHFLGQLSEVSKEKWGKFAKNEGVLEHIFFDGTRPSGDGVKDWLDNLDLFILPSYTEGLGRSLIEAMSIGLPCVGTNVGGIPEILDINNLCRPKNAKSLADRIYNILSDKGKMKKSARENFGRAKSFDYEKLKKSRDIFYIEARDGARND